MMNALQQKKMHFKENDLFCPKCGQPLYYVCKRCGMQLPDNTRRYCLRCENELKDKKDEPGKTIIEAVVIGAKKAGEFALDKGRAAAKVVEDAASDIKETADKLIEEAKEKKKQKDNNALNKKEDKSIDLDDLNKLIDLVRSIKKIEWGGGNVIDKTEDGKDIRQWPYPIYPDGLFESLCGLFETDRNYIENYEKLGDPIDYENLNEEELRTVITHYIRGERFCDGLIAGAIENGILLKVLERIREIYAHYS